MKPIWEHMQKSLWVRCLVSSNTSAGRRRANSRGGAQKREDGRSHAALKEAKDASENQVQRKDVARSADLVEPQTPPPQTPPSPSTPPTVTFTPPASMRRQRSRRMRSWREVDRRDVDRSAVGRADGLGAFATSKAAVAVVAAAAAGRRGGGTMSSSGVSGDSSC